MTKTQTATLAELRAMHDSGELQAPGPDAPETDMPDAFWDSAKPQAAMGVTYTTEQLETFTRHPRPHRKGEALATEVYADPGNNGFYYRDRKPDSVARYVRDDLIAAELIAARKRIAELERALDDAEWDI